MLVGRPLPAPLNAVPFLFFLQREEYPTPLVMIFTASAHLL
jgi:hypothetical protein